MMYTVTRKKLLASVFVLLAAVCIVGIYATVTGAAGMNQFSNKLTNPSDVMAGGVEGKVDLHLKNVTGIAVVDQNKMALYYPMSVADNKDSESGNPTLGTTNKMKLKITKGRDGGYCKVPSDADGTIQVEVLGEVIWQKPAKNACTDFIGATIPFKNGSSFQKDKGNNLFKAQITVRFKGSDQSPSSQSPQELGGNTDGYSLNYNMEFSDAEAAHGNKGKLALLGNTGAREFGFRSAYRDHPNAAPNRQVKVSVPFGFPCETDPNNVAFEKRSAKLYDPDKGFGEAYIWITKDGSPLNQGQYAPQGQFENIDGWDGTNKRWKVKEGDRLTVRIVLAENASAISDNSAYSLVVLNTGKKGNSNSDLNPHMNTLSLSIPQDSINASNKCDYELKPTVRPPASATSSAELGSSVSVRGHVTPDGFDKDTHSWRLTAHVFEAGQKPSQASAGSTDNGPCAWRPGKFCAKVADSSGGDGVKFKDEKFDTPMYNFDTTGLEVNDWVCFVMSVLRPNPDAVGKWAHSDMKCVKMAGEAVGTVVTPNTYSYYPDLAVTTKIENKDNYPKVDNFYGQNYTRNTYEWRILEAKFRSKPSDIGTADRGGCNTIQSVSGFIPGTCREVNSGSNLFPPGTSSTTRTASSNQEGPDPIGTWTCYTTSYLKNPRPRPELRADIDLYASHWNDDNWSSPARWGGDGYGLSWQDTSYYDEEKEKWVSQGYWYYSGTPVNANDIWNGFVTSSPDSTNPEYKFTPYKTNSCSVSGIDPKVQVRSHDVQVGGTIDSFIRTLTKGNAIGSYGSNAEYGALSGGVNARMASGSGLVRGGSQDQSSWSPLTFTNNTSTFGNFSGVLQANRPSASSAQEITSTNQISLAPGSKNIYHVNGTLTINSNLEYPNSYGLISDIPRVIIIADTIEIGPNVTRIDPWLVAENISTCNSITTDYSNTPQQALGEADLTIGQCSNPLIFNGPVYVSNLYLYRTGGSRIPRSDILAVSFGWNFNPDLFTNPDTYCEGGSCGVDDDGRRYSFSAPAEVFNLRPDAYLSALAGLRTNKPVAITDKITELPPRF